MAGRLMYLTPSVIAIVLFSHIISACGPAVQPLNNQITTHIPPDSAKFNKNAYQAEKDEIVRFTKKIVNISGGCQASTYLHEYRSETILYDYEAGIKSVREKCNPQVMIFAVPGYCEPCQKVYQLMRQHAKIMMDGVDLIELVNATYSQRFLTAGLEKFWQAKELRIGINRDVESLRREYGLIE